MLAARRAPVAPREDPRGVAVVRGIAWAAAGAALVAWPAAVLARDGVPTGYRGIVDVAFDAGTGAGATILVLAVAASLAVDVRRARRR